MGTFEEIKKSVYRGIDTLENPPSGLRCRRRHSQGNASSCLGFEPVIACFRLFVRTLTLDLRICTPLKHQQRSHKLQCAESACNPWRRPTRQARIRGRRGTNVTAYREQSNRPRSGLFRNSTVAFFDRNHH